MTCKKRKNNMKGLDGSFDFSNLYLFVVKYRINWLRVMSEYIQN